MNIKMDQVESPPKDEGPIIEVEPIIDVEAINDVEATNDVEDDKGPSVENTKSDNSPTGKFESVIVRNSVRTFKNRYESHVVKALWSPETSTPEKRMRRDNESSDDDESSIDYFADIVPLPEEELDKIFTLHHAKEDKNLALGALKKQVEEACESKAENKKTTTLADVMKNKPQSAVSHIFMATLMLAGENKLSFVRNDEQDGPHTAEQLGLKLKPPNP